MKRLHLTVAGVVQGVGFRPFLHRMAARYGLTGWVRNTGQGVELEWQGQSEVLDSLLPPGPCESLRWPGLPPLAVLQSVTVTPCAVKPEETEFTILPSAADGRNTLVSPDIATCPDCLRELFTPGDRRYRYPFVNCTNCGPRFTIVKRVPYDRANTTMEPFAMCGRCAAEYADITDRRYHAQPDCCPACGPRLWYAGADGQELPGDAVTLAQKTLRRGGIVAVKGLGGFHLACGIDAGTVERLRRRKHRPARPLAILCPDLDRARRLCTITETEAAALQSARAPIVLCRKRDAAAWPWLSLTDELGILLPYTPLHHLLAAGFDALVFTSANLSGLPALTDNAEALTALSGVADGFLLHDRAIEARCDDSLLRVLPDGGYFIRRSRGYAPQPVPLAFSVDGLAAMGAEQKASFALGKECSAFYSQHIGDVKNAETLAHYENQMARYRDLFGCEPQLAVCDLHPDYLTTRLAAASGLPVVRVQHHHAHMASCMADNALTGDCIGIVWDGTGLGGDGTVWGGEFLIGGYADVTRAASLRPIPLPGGDAAIHKIGRIAAALQWEAARAGLADPSEETPVIRLLQKGLHCPPSSGMGRLFDGVYALLTGCAEARYEGEGAVLLETLAYAAPDETGRYPVSIEPDENGLPRLDHRPITGALLADKAAGTSPAVCARRFHNTLTEAAVQVCRRLGETSGLTRVVLSGGVFLNRILLHRITQELQKAGFTVYRHHRVSTTDEGVALGQLAVAAHRKGKENVSCRTTEN